VFPDGVTYVLPSGAIPGVPSRPAKAGDTITLYGIGFGAVTPGTPAGQITGESNMLNQPFHFYFEPTFPGTEAAVTYAGLAPGVVGLYQFNVVIPKLSVTGDVRVYFTFGGSAIAGLGVITIQ
jgi:uncharacterized protein (TIGR03437 family)